MHSSGKLLHPVVSGATSAAKGASNKKHVGLEMLHLSTQSDMMPVKPTILIILHYCCVLSIEKFLCKAAYIQAFLWLQSKFFCSIMMVSRIVGLFHR
jgi:hypothetical protein